MLTLGVCWRNRLTVMSPMVVWINTRSGISLKSLGTARCSAETLGLRSGRGTKAGALGPPPPKNALIASIFDCNEYQCFFLTVDG